MTDDDQLEEIFIRHKIRREVEPPRFSIVAREDDIAWALGQLEISMRQSEVFPRRDYSSSPPKVEECKSEDSFDEAIDDTSSDDDERDEREMMQCIKHFIRLEVEKRAFELIE